MSKVQKRKIYLSGVRKSALDQARGRLFLISVFFVFAYVIVAARAADLSLIQGNIDRQEQESSYLNHQKAQTERADIKDRNGVILARSLKMFSLYADPALISDPAKAAEDLVNIFPDLTYGSLLKDLQSKKRFVWIKRNISPDEQSSILQLGYPGLGFREEMKRVYPQGALTVHAVGATGIDGQGLAGIEASFDDLLNDREEPLYLTIDVRLQHALRREIEKAVELHKAKAGVGLIMDVDSGEVLSAVSLPDYDPHDYSHAKDHEVFNRFSLGVYELGSTFKIFSTAALLEKEGASLAQTFDVREPIEVGRFKIRDYHPEKRILTLPEVFIHSSNIGSAMIGQEVGSETLQKFFRDLGLFESPEFEVPEIGNPLIPNPWREVNTMTASYGHGIAVSPLQLVRAVSSIVNGGILVNPTIVLHQKNQDKNTKKSALRVVSPQTSHRMRQLMRLVVTEGTGSHADIKGFLVGGKTGTAEKPGKGGYSRKSLLSSFLGVFPMDEPKYAVFVMIDEPQGIKQTFGYSTGGWVAAPAVGSVIAALASINGIKPEEGQDGFEKSLMRYVKTKEQLKLESEIETH
jgi:cell division protein FtsI (penicillin-binding protein 3)